MLSRLVNGYASLLSRYPLKVSLVTGFCLSSTADTIAQSFEPTKPYDPYRSLRMGTYAFCAWVPVAFFWFRYAERRWPGKRLANMTKKLGVDQLVVCPTLLFCYLGTNELLQGKGITGAAERIKHDFVSTQMKNFAVWTPAQLANFYLIPELWRVLFTRTVSFFWQTYLSWRGKTHFIYYLQRQI